MSEPVLLDTGPLVALLDKRDEHHNTCLEFFAALKRPMVTCWPVVTEAAWLLRRLPRGPQLLLEWCADIVEMAELGQEALPWIAAFQDRYRDLSPQLADSALMYLGESRSLDTVFTLDRRDFTVFTFASGRSPNVVPQP